MKSKTEDIHIRVPARVCLFGDHQDYLGLPVIAAAINRYITLTAQSIAERYFKIRLPDINQNRSIDIQHPIDALPPNDYFLSGIKLFQEQGVRFKQGYQITISSDIPINAGLSSSSALVVAWIRFLLSIQNKISKPSDLEIGKMAHQVEVSHFNQPGGIMDQYTISQRGMLYIDTTTRECTSFPKNLNYLIIADSGIEKRTLQVLLKAKTYALEAVQQVKNKYPNFDLLQSSVTDYKKYKDLVSQELQPYWYATIHNYSITLKAKALLQKVAINQQQIGQLINQHQDILQTCIQNTPIEMQNQIQRALQAGALGAKTVGSGGGGCIVALANQKTKNKVIRAFLGAGSKKAYPIEIV
ncbi:MAG: GHMP kinase [Flavobacteriaceae bacterium]|nr:GHMP kinase [Flavobacteriaceae bacterium]